MEKESKIVVGKNTVAGILSVLGGISLLVYGKDRLNTYLVVVFSFMVFLGALLVVLSFLRRNDNRLDRVLARELILIALLFINPLFGKLLGFYITGYLEIVLISLLIEKELDRRAVVKTLLVCLAIAILSYLVFSVVLKIHCPTGTFHLV